MFHCVFRLALLVTASFLHIKSVSVSRPPCYPYFNPPGVHLSVTSRVVRIPSCTCSRDAILRCLFVATLASLLSKDGSFGLS